jgi:hypothetical protein
MGEQPATQPQIRGLAPIDFTSYGLAVIQKPFFLLSKLWNDSMVLPATKCFCHQMDKRFEAAAI